MRLWRATVTCTLSVILLAFAVAQDKPKVEPSEKTIAPLTDKEKLAVRSAQVKRYELLEQKKQVESQLDAAIAEADKGVQETVNAIYAERKITQAEFSLCENPTPGACASAPAGDVSLQPIKKEAKK